MLEVESRAAAYTTFCRLWTQLLPSLVLMKPMSDLCWKCQQNSTATLRTASSPESVKLAKRPRFVAVQDILEDLDMMIFLIPMNQCWQAVMMNSVTWTLTSQINYPPGPSISLPLTFSSNSTTTPTSLNFSNEVLHATLESATTPTGPSPISFPSCRQLNTDSQGFTRSWSGEGTSRSRSCL